MTAIAFVLALFVAPAVGRAGPLYVDRHVVAIPAETLLHADPRTLVDPRRQTGGVVLERIYEPLFFAWAASQIVAYYLFWKLGGAARMRAAIAARVRNATQLRFCYGFALAVFGALAAAPASFARYRLAVAFDLSHETLLGWMRVSLANVALDALGVGIVVAIVFAFVDRLRLWWIWSIATLFLVTLFVNFIAPVAITPLYEHTSPIAPASHVGRRIDALERRVHLARVPDFHVATPQRTSVAMGRADGFLSTKRIVVSDSAIATLTPGELDVLVATALGHYVASDGLKTALLGTFLFILCIALGVTLSDRAGFRRDDDPLARLSLVAAFVGVIALVALPIYHIVVRHLDAGAEAYALALTHDRASAARLYVRLADEGLEPLCPGRVQRWYFALTPPPLTRIDEAVDRPNGCR